MDKSFLELFEGVYRNTKKLVDQYIDAEDLETDADYLCIFPKDQDEYLELKQKAEHLGENVQASSTGNWIWLREPVQTKYGWIRMIRIHTVDSQKPWRGYADFGTPHYSRFKTKYLSRPGFSKIIHPDFEMIELKDKNYDVLVYIPDTPLSQDLGLR